ncbi:MAG: hypothetical protein IJ636_01405 [Bacteroidales bacterium]|mgnify:CR=1 FL=1|nr:hypothetical protein [Bacteroidales bacterium]
MKKILILLLAVTAAVLVLSSCKETLPKRFEIFANQVEKRADKFSEDDWKKANAQFEKLLQEYKDNRDSFNADEKKQINQAIGKYAGIVAKSGFNSAIKALDGMIKELPSLLDSLGGFLKGLGGEKTN